MTAPLNQNTPEDVIRSAMLNSYLLEKGQDPTSEDFVLYITMLNDLVQFYQTQGLKLFLWQDITISLVAGQQDYYLETSGGAVNMLNPLQIRECYYKDVNNNTYPLIPASWNEWELLSQPQQQGALNTYMVDKQASAMRVRFWLVPDTTAATGTVHVLVRTRIPRYVGLYDTVQFPSEWAIFLKWALAHEISVGQPAEVIAFCRQKMEFYRDALEGFDVEDNAMTSFQPDPRYQYSGSRFR